MAVSLDLLINAIVAGILLGGFYAAVTLGITITFTSSSRRWASTPF
jgi:branched-chain amino acid transport system permease protein